MNKYERMVHRGRQDRPGDRKTHPRLYKLEESGYDGVVRKPEEVIPKTVAALTRAFEWDDKIPIGVFYQNELLSTYQERISQRITNIPALLQQKRSLLTIWVSR